MSKSRKIQSKRTTIKQVSADDPIYTSGYVMLRPISGRRQATSVDDVSVNNDSTDIADAGQASSESDN
jgi:hypothetical protein